MLKTDGFTDDYDEYTEDPVDKTLEKTGKEQLIQELVHIIHMT